MEGSINFREDKMKKIIVYLTIFSLLNLAGCYYQKQMNPSEFNFNDKEDIQVTTKDTTYNLSGKDYYYEKDTVFATMRIKLDAQSTLKTNIEIPVEEIKTVAVEKTDALATTFTVIGVVVGTFAVIITLGFIIADSGH